MKCWMTDTAAINDLTLEWGAQQEVWQTDRTKGLLCKTTE
jgi:hypothetical protein